MIIQITDKCSRGCKHCFLSCKASSNNFMSLEDFKYLIDTVANKTLNIVISGGEPLEHPNVIEMIEYALEKSSFLVTLLTSGINIDILKVIKNRRFTVQITNDDRFYPVNDKLNKDIEDFMNNKNIEVTKSLVDSLSHIVELGRAKDNGINKYNTRYAGCANSILQLVQIDIDDISDWLNIENKTTRVCMSMVDYKLDFYLGECKQLKICNLKADDFAMYMNYYKHNIDTLMCNKCGFNNVEQVKEVLLQNNIGW